MAPLWRFFLDRENDAANALQGALYGVLCGAAGGLLLGTGLLLAMRKLAKNSPLGLLTNPEFRQALSGEK